jgi:hypothetical protein
MHLPRPKAWKRARRGRDALVDYPLFAPPYRRHSALMDVPSAVVNERYFFFAHGTPPIGGPREFLRACDVEPRPEGLAASRR